MKITDIIAKKDLTLSFEVFPPKNGTDGEAIVAAAEEIADLHPDFMSVTYGAGGSSSKHTAKIAATLTEKARSADRRPPHLRRVKTRRHTQKPR